MIIDILVLILVIMAVFKGLREGLVMALFSFLAFIIGLTLAIKLSAVAAGYIGENVNVSQRWLPVIAFAVVFLIVVFLVRLGARAIEGVLRVAMLGWANRLAGAALYVLLYLFILSLLLFYAVQLNVVKPETTEASVTYPFIKQLGLWITNAMGAIIPIFRDMFTELESYFDEVAKTN
jgi:membrane protein required for colicin V production